MTRGGVPSVATVLLTLMRVSLLRLVRARALWVSIVIACLPIILGAVHRGRTGATDLIAVVQAIVLALLPPLFVASAIGEEIEDRTATYLWSRPIPRWTLVIGKLLALSPIAIVLVAGSWYVACLVADEPASAQSVVALGLGAFAIATVSAGLATVVPRHGMAISVVYLVVFDLGLGLIPASINSLSITRQVLVAAGLRESVPLAQPAITMLAIAGVWLAIALVRIRRLEA